MLVLDTELFRLVAQTLALAVLFGTSHIMQRRLIKREGHDSRVFTDVGLKRLNGTVTAIIHSWPGPAFIKVAHTEGAGTVFRMLELNEAYEKAYGVSRLHCIGRTDAEAGWDSKKAEEWRANDIMVWASGESEILQEDYVEGDCHKKRTFIKVRITSPDGSAKGIMGLCVDAVRDRCPAQQIGGCQLGK